MGFTKEQLQFIKHNTTDSVILSATAGSGKTASATGRLKWLLNKGVKPEKIIYFSFTNDAVNELRSRINDDRIEITTIHSFCARVLGKSKKFKPLVDLSSFPNWFKKNYAPKKKATIEEKLMYNRLCQKLDNDPNKIYSDISKYKIITSDGTKAMMPSFFYAYQKFLQKTRTRDFVDMLTDTLHLTDYKSWENNWEYKYDYVFVDEYQDISTIQMQILLKLRAKVYHLIGDRNQSIYGFQGSDCRMIEKLLKEKKIVKEYNLTKNFRSAKNIVENSNNYSDLFAVPHSEVNGTIKNKFLTESELYKLLKKKETVLLARTNNVIKGLELKFLSKKIPMQYNNILDEEDLEIIKEKKPLKGRQSSKFKKILQSFGGSADDLVKFIEANRDSPNMVTSIHKSKGREYKTCIVVNSFAPELLEYNDIELEKKEFKRYSFDREDINDAEAKNIYYVAITRPKQNLYYLMVDEDTMHII